MTKETITLTLEGDIPIDLFAKVMGHFSSLIKNLSDEIVGSEQIEWLIAGLTSGSATAEVIGLHHDKLLIERVVRGYEVVGRALEQNDPIPYSEYVIQNAHAITGVLNGHIKAVKFITDAVSSRVVEHHELQIEDEKSLFSLGVVTGRVEAIWSRPKPRLGVYDLLFDRVVYCYLDDTQQEIARDAWGKVAEITGNVKRDPETGRPIEVRQVKDVKPHDILPSLSFMKASGALSWQEGDEPAEVLIRRVRHGIE